MLKLTSACDIDWLSGEVCFVEVAQFTAPHGSHESLDVLISVCDHEPK
jgi:hypothetical protein